MADDDALYKYALRVRARAIRRCGQLLEQIEKKPGKRTDREPRAGGGPRSQAAEDAGLSERKKKTALRVANVPEQEFDAAVDSDTPPTISALAEQGTRKQKTPTEMMGDRNPADFRSATKTLVALREFVEMTEQCDLAAICCPLSTAEHNPAAQGRGCGGISWALFPCLLC